LNRPPCGWQTKKRVRLGDREGMTGTRLLRDRLSVQNRFARLARAGVRLPVLFFQRARDQHLTGPFEERRGAARQPERRKGTVQSQAAPGAPAEQACPPVESVHAMGHDRGKNAARLRRGPYARQRIDPGFARAGRQTRLVSHAFRRSG
jgi:hypothetical protein